MNGVMKSVTGFTILGEEKEQSRQSSEVTTYVLEADELSRVLERVERKRGFGEPTKATQRFEQIPLKRRKKCK